MLIISKIILVYCLVISTKSIFYYEMKERKNKWMDGWMELYTVCDKRVILCLVVSKFGLVFFFRWKFLCNFYSNDNVHCKQTHACIKLLLH